MLLDLLIGLGWVAATCALVLGVHALTRRLLPPRPPADAKPGEDYSSVVREAASAIAVRAAALYGVLLALVYAQQLADYQAVRGGLVREAASVADVYWDATLYGGAAAPIREHMREYVRQVAGREWTVLRTEQRLSRRAWEVYNLTYGAALDLVPRTPREQALRDHLLRRLADIADHRHARQEIAARDFGAVFWAPAVLGLVLVAMTFFVFPPTREVRALLAAFGAFAGVVLFLIHAFGNPFGPPLRYSPRPFERLLEGSLSASRAEALSAPPAPGSEPAAGGP